MQPRPVPMCTSTTADSIFTSCLLRLLVHRPACSLACVLYIDRHIVSTNSPKQYDIGVTGGVTSMPDFLETFFPDVHAQTTDPASSDPYCQYDNIQLQMFTSSLFFAGMFASLAAIWLNKLVGRRGTMLIASLWFLAGALMTGARQCLFEGNKRRCMVSRVSYNVNLLHTSTSVFPCICSLHEAAISMHHIQLFAEQRCSQTPITTTALTRPGLCLLDPAAGSHLLGCGRGPCQPVCPGLPV